MTGRTNAVPKASVEAFPYMDFSDGPDEFVSGQLTATASNYNSSKVLQTINPVSICEVSGSVTSYGTKWEFGPQSLICCGTSAYAEVGAGSITVSLDTNGVLTVTLAMFFPNSSYAGKTVSAEVNVTKVRSFSSVSRSGG